MKVLVVLVAACFASSQAAYSGYGGYNGPQASPVVTPNGFLADTPEVAAAKAAHFSEVAKVSAPSGYAPGPYNGASAYNQPAPYNAAPYNPAPYNPAPYNPAPAASPYANNPSVTPQGYLADTPEIAAAKAAHFAEVAKTRTNPSYGPEAYDDGSYRPEYDNPNYGAPAAPQSYAAPNSYAPATPAYNQYASAPASYNQYASAPASYNPAPAAYNSYAAPSPTGGYRGPLATPQVTAQGFLAETPEVAAAKAAHFAEVAKAGSHGRYRRSAVLVQTPASTAPLAVAPVAYSAPVAYTAPVAYSAPVYSYAAPYSYLRAPAGYAYSVRTW